MGRRKKIETLDGSVLRINYLTPQTKQQKPSIEKIMIKLYENKLLF